MQLVAKTKRPAPPAGASGGADASTPAKKQRAAAAAGDAADLARDAGGEASTESAASPGQQTQTGAVEQPTEAVEAPQPSQLLEGCTAPPTCVPLDVALGMNEEAFLAARSMPHICGLQLRVSSTSTEELQSFPARVPAADAFALSPVLQTRLSSWEAGAAADGVTVLELQLGVRQQLLDAVVRGVYARKLTVEPSNAESLLLLADYLQLGWLTQAVAGYLKEHVLSERPLALYELSQRFSGLDLCQPATHRVLQRLQPQESAALARLAPKSERIEIYRAVARWDSPAQVLEFMFLMGRMEREIRPSHTAAHAIASRHPELAVAMWDVQSEGEGVDFTTEWAFHYELHHEAVHRERLSRPVLVWLIPLEELRVLGRCQSTSCLTMGDGRTFCLQAVREKGHHAQWQRNLYVCPCDGTVWSEDDYFGFSTVKGPARRDEDVVAREDDGTDVCIGIGTNLIDDWTRNDEHTVCNGAYLPVMLDIY